MKYNPKIHHRRSIRLKGYDYSQAGLYFVTICVKDRKHLFGNIADGKMILNDAGKMVERWYYELKNKYPDVKCGEFIVMPNHFHCIVIKNGFPVPVGADLCVCPENDDDDDDGDGRTHRFAPTIAPTIAPIVTPTIIPIVAPTILGEQNEMIFGENNILGDDILGGDILGDGILGDDILGDGILGEHNILGDDILGEHNILGDDILGEHVGSPLRDIVRWFKTMSTNEYIRGVKNYGWPPFNRKLWQRNYWEHIIRNEQSYQRISEYIVNNPANWQKDKLFH
jgi:REP element-mobilizing transposase RayT